MCSGEDGVVTPLAAVGDSAAYASSIIKDSPLDLPVCGGNGPPRLMTEGLVRDVRHRSERMKGLARSRFSSDWDYELFICVFSSAIIVLMTCGTNYVNDIWATMTYEALEVFLDGIQGIIFLKICIIWFYYMMQGIILILFYYMTLFYYMMQGIIFLTENWYYMMKGIIFLKFLVYAIIFH